MNCILGNSYLVTLIVTFNGSDDENDISQLLIKSVKESDYI